MCTSPRHTIVPLSGALAYSTHTLQKAFLNAFSIQSFCKADFLDFIALRFNEETEAKLRMKQNENGNGGRIGGGDGGGGGGGLDGGGMEVAWWWWR